MNELKKNNKEFEGNDFFSIEEMSSPDIKYSGVNMDLLFMEKLTEARIIANIPFVINSAYRTKNHNKKVKGVLNSSHTKGLAVDIKVNTSRDRFIILEALMLVNFNRIGIGRTFIHVDYDSIKPKGVVWLY